MWSQGAGRQAAGGGEGSIWEMDEWGGVGRKEELRNPYEDAGRIYGAVCGGDTIGKPAESLQARAPPPPPPPLESAGQLSRERCGGAEMLTMAQTPTINNAAAESPPRSSFVAVPPRAQK